MNINLSQTLSKNKEKQSQTHPTRPGKDMTREENHRPITLLTTEADFLGKIPADWIPQPNERITHHLVGFAPEGNDSKPAHQ